MTHTCNRDRRFRGVSSKQWDTHEVAICYVNGWANSRQRLGKFAPTIRDFAAQRGFTAAARLSDFGNHVGAVEAAIDLSHGLSQAVFVLDKRQADMALAGGAEAAAGADGDVALIQ